MVSFGSLKNFSQFCRFLKSFFLLSITTAVISLSLSGYVHAAQVTLSWEHSSDPAVVGYKIHYGTASKAYSQSIDAGYTTSYTVTGLTDNGTYYFAATAYDASGNQSGYSNEVIKTLSVNGATVELGDIDGSGEVTIQDVLRALRISTGSITATSTDLAGGDVAPLVNGTPVPDGQINLQDVLVILQKVAGTT